MLNSITSEFFKKYFPREFNYLDSYNSLKPYKKDEITCYMDYFYNSLVNRNLNHQPDLEASKEYWEEIEEDKNNYISDDDIKKAFSQAKGVFNINLFSQDFSIIQKREEESEELTLDNITILETCYLLLSAHFLVIDLQMANGNGASSFIMSSKSVDGVSASYSIPQTLLNSPYYSYLAKTEFGLKYLQYIAPRLNGYNKIVQGATSYL